MQINTYLNFNGNTEEAFQFYQSIFGGELSIMKYKDSPGAEEMSEEDQNKVVHVCLPIGSHMLMATDFLESTGQKVIVGNNVSISLHPDSKEEADRLFNGLSEGGTVEMPMEDAFWGDYFGAFKDKFGIGWMINCEVPKKRV